MRVDPLTSSPIQQPTRVESNNPSSTTDLTVNKTVKKIGMETLSQSSSLDTVDNKNYFFTKKVSPSLIKVLQEYQAQKPKIETDLERAFHKMSELQQQANKILISLHEKNPLIEKEMRKSLVEDLKNINQQISILDRLKRKLKKRQNQVEISVATPHKNSQILHSLDQLKKAKEILEIQLVKTEALIKKIK